MFYLICNCVAFEIKSVQGTTDSPEEGLPASHNLEIIQEIHHHYHHFFRRQLVFGKRLSWDTWRDKAHTTHQPQAPAAARFRKTTQSHAPSCPARLRHFVPVCSFKSSSLQGLLQPSQWPFAFKTNSFCTCLARACALAHIQLLLGSD